MTTRITKLHQLALQVRQATLRLRKVALETETILAEVDAQLQSITPRKRAVKLTVVDGGDK